VAIDGCHCPDRSVARTIPVMWGQWLWVVAEPDPAVAEALGAGAASGELCGAAAAGVRRKGLPRWGDGENIVN